MAIVFRPVKGLVDIFFGSIFILIIVLTVIQGTKVNGSLKMAIFTLLGGIVITIIIYALVKEVA
jgi:hypothetical protein